MGGSFYAITLQAIRTQLAETFGGQLVECQAPQGNIVQHLLWMCTEVEKAERTVHNALRAARWVGWMLHAVEMLGIWSNDASRSFVRMDVEAGNDLPDNSVLKALIADAEAKDRQGSLTTLEQAFTTEARRIAP